VGSVTLKRRLDRLRPKHEPVEIRVVLYDLDADETVIERAREEMAAQRARGEIAIDLLRRPNDP
jgi:hypothetical protein